MAEGKIPQIRLIVRHVPATVGFPVFALVGVVVSVKVIGVMVIWAICCMFEGSQTSQKAPGLCQKQR